MARYPEEMLKPCLHAQLSSGHKYGSHLRGFVMPDVMCCEAVHERLAISGSAEPEHSRNVSTLRV